MDRSWMATVAGVLNIIAGALSIVGVMALVFASTIVGHIAAEEKEFPLFAVETLLGGFAALGLIVALLAIVGGIFALRRRRFGWAITGAIAACFSFPPLGVPAVILVVLAEKELRGATE
jgi:hypothetical protein